MSKTVEVPIVTDLRVVGRGVERPEQVVVDRSGRVFVSDARSAVAEIIGPDEIRRVGAAAGDPNGIAMCGEDRFVIPNFGHGALQELDIATEQMTDILTGSVDGRSIKWVNCVAVDSGGALWCSVSTQTDEMLTAVAHGIADGLLVRVSADRSTARVAAEGVYFPNCIALDRDGRYLYVVRTIAADVVRFAVDGDTLGPEERFGPSLGERRPDEFGDEALALLADPEVGRRWGMADGCAFDAGGNLWVTLVFANRIVAISPDGAASTIVEDADGKLLNAPTSVAWGGADLCDVYFGSLNAPYVVAGRSSVPGMAMPWQR